MSWRCADPPAEPVRVVLVGSEVDVTSGLVRRLESCDDLAVVGSFSSVDAAVSGVSSIEVEVVLVDAELVEVSGLELCARLRRDGHQLACLVHSGVPLAASVAAGFDAVVLKSLTGEVLEREIVRLGRLVASDSVDAPDSVDARRS